MSAADVLIGIDPGVLGAVAILSPDGRAVLAVHDMPTRPGDKGGASRLVDLRAMLDILRPYSGAVAMVEEQVTMGKQSAAGALTIGRNYQTILNACEMLDIGTRIVRAQAWKKKLRLIGADKKAAISLAESMYPQSRGLFTRHDRADAVLIARSAGGDIV